MNLFTVSSPSVRGRHTLTVDWLVASRLTVKGFWISAESLFCIPFRVFMLALSIQAFSALAGHRAQNMDCMGMTNCQRKNGIWKDVLELQLPLWTWTVSSVAMYIFQSRSRVRHALIGAMLLSFIGMLSCVLVLLLILDHLRRLPGWLAAYGQTMKSSNQVPIVLVPNKVLAAPACGRRKYSNELQRGSSMSRKFTNGVSAAHTRRSSSSSNLSTSHGRSSSVLWRQRLPSQHHFLGHIGR
ncbi:hypothetical protein M514_01225 [Trichuris suis]|uniref:Uncharacterized protein n=1 Tax=Trichuris suis TaxID=68888 RepID=A0A085ML96_9BILA|nr:hypothetical protein M513_01225 [Trichuris suis]KFD70820.1 hypothetical protein M514_01225 [Trichuris suis]KHJ45846.1 hypothetical protein D918_04058 [Trichuris suis]